MKKIMLNIPISDIKAEFYNELRKKYNIEIIKNNKLVNLVMWRGFLPLILFGYAWPIKQKPQYKYICELFNLNNLKLALFSKYDVWVSTNLFSISTLFSFLICKLRKKKIYIRFKKYLQE